MRLSGGMRPRRQGRGLAVPRSHADTASSVTVEDCAKTEVTESRMAPRRAVAPAPMMRLSMPVRTSRVGHRRSSVSGEQQQVVQEAREERAYS